MRIEYRREKKKRKTKLEEGDLPYFGKKYKWEEPERERERGGVRDRVLRYT